MAKHDKTADRLLQELQTHQIELELQNQELQNQELHNEALSLAHDELRRARDRYAELYNGAPVGYLTLDQAGLVLELNRRGTELLVAPRERLLGQRFAGLVCAEDQDALHLLWRRVQADGGRHELDLRLRRPDDNGSWVHSEWLVVEAASGPRSFWVTLSDITAQKVAEQQAREHKERLQQLVAQVGLVEVRERKQLAELLHDHVAQSLVALQIELKLLQAEAQGERQAKLAELAGVAQRLVRQTRDLTYDLSPPESIDGDLVARIEGLTERHRQLHRCPVTLTDDEAPKPLSEVVQTILSLAVRELLANVARHAGASLVQVHLLRAGDRVVVSVADDGVGIGGRSDEGFGLFCIRERMTTVGGALRLEPRSPRGTRATLEVPLASEAASTP
jgi:PAS domain S-box-containing protein